MSYQVLARKWRPKNFEQLMGQEHVVTVLVNALTQQRLHHAYLFTGTRGVGKTTIARIFAKSLNCETGITATPCGVCDICQDIDQGRFIDLLEIDAASRTKVDDTREILDNVQYAPTRGRYKVYLIDEVHMLSRSSFNALLKTLEEPPEHVKFILATTDPQKLPITVLSRCLQFHLKALTVSQIEAKLAQILLSENVDHDAGSLTLLAKSARGSMRDSLSLTDQAIAQGQGNILLANLQQMLGGIDQNWVYKILICLIKQDGSQLMELSQQIAAYAPNYNRLFAELIQLLHQTAMYQVVNKHIDLSAEHAMLVEKFSQSLSAEDIQLYYQIALNGRKDLPYASDEQAAFDMMLLRLLAFKPMTAEYCQENQANVESTIEQDTATSADESDSLRAFDEFNDGTELDNLENPSSNKGVVQAPKLEVQPDISKSSQSARSSVQTSPEPVVENIETVVDVNTINEELNQSMLALEQAAANEFLSHVEQVQPRSEPEMNNIPEQSQVEELSSEQVQIEQAPVEPMSPMSSILAARNQLRSQKKQQAQPTKKLNDANARLKNTAPSNENQDVNQASSNTEEKSPLSAANSIEQANPLDENKPDVAPVPAENYSPDAIDPATVRLANQIDKWANMIDSMSLKGRIRQLAIHATICDSSTDNYLKLLLDQSTKHLKSNAAHQQLQAALSVFLQKKIVVDIEVVEKTVADPYQIQSHINDKRYDYAKELLLADDIVIRLQNEFQAVMNESTIMAR